MRFRKKSTQFAGKHSGNAGKQQNTGCSIATVAHVYGENIDLSNGLGVSLFSKIGSESLIKSTHATQCVGWIKEG
jgi:hypothetical protein